MDRERGHEREGDHDERDDEPGAQLAEVLHEGRLLTVQEAPRKALQVAMGSEGTCPGS